MFDFPSNPALGAQVGHGDIIYTWDGQKWTFGPHGVSAFLPLTGGTMTGALVLYGPPQAPLEAATKAYTDTKLPLGGGTLTGPLLLSQDPTAPAMAATKAYVDSRSGVISFNNRTGAVALQQNDVTPLGFYTGTQTDARYVYKTGDTITGSLTVNGNLLGGYVRSTGSMQVDGNFNSNNNVIGGWIYSNGDFGGHNCYIDGGLGLNFRGVYNSGVWYAFGWDGHLHIAINGGGQGPLAFLRDIGYSPNQNVDYNSSPTFWDLHVGGTLYAQNGNATHQFSNINVGGNTVSGYIKSNGWTDTQNLHVFSSNANFDGDIHIQGMDNCRGVVTHETSGDWFSFWVSGSAYIRMDGTWDYGPIGYASDARLKRDIEPAEVDCLDLVRRIALKRFRWLDTDSEVPIGFITQQLKEVLLEAVNTQPKNMPRYSDRRGVFYESVNHNVLLALLTGAVQQLAKGR